MHQDDISNLERRHGSPAPIHDAAAFEGMRRAGRLTAEALDLLVEAVAPGVTTEALDRLVFDFAMDHGAYPATLFYRGYTKSICTSINHVVCHGIPNDKPLREGDILNIDVTLVLDGWHGDSSRMFFVGEVARRAARLCDITYECLMKGVAAVAPGRTTGAIGTAIQTHAERERCSVVRDFCGHGLGRVFHDAPTILHYFEATYAVPLLPGMLFTVEPMINLGRPQVKVCPTAGRGYARPLPVAQFEHTVGVTKDGVEVFTYSPKGYHRPPYAIAA
jgi:methionyl aminopeptidase